MKTGLTKKFILEIYLLLSLATAIGFVLIKLSGNGSGGDFISSLINNTLSFLILPAILWILIIPKLIFRKNETNYGAVINYFKKAINLGIFLIFIDLLWLFLQHADCGSGCVSSVLTYSQSWLCVAILIFPLIIFPALSIHKFKKPSN